MDCNINPGKLHEKGRSRDRHFGTGLLDGSNYIMKMTDHRGIIPRNGDIQNIAGCDLERTTPAPSTCPLQPLAVTHRTNVEQVSLPIGNRGKIGVRCVAVDQLLAALLDIETRDAFNHFRCFKIDRHLETSQRIARCLSSYLLTYSIVGYGTGCKI